MKNKIIPKISVYSTVAIFFFGLAKICSAADYSLFPPIKYNTLQELILGVLSYLRGIAGIIGVIFIIIGGIMYMLSMGNEQRMERAKKTVTYAIVGLVIVIAAPSFLKEIILILGGNVNGMSGPTLQQILMNVLMFLLSIVGSLSIISTLMGSFWILTAYGNENRIELGKKTVMYSVIGTTIALGSLVIVQQISSLLMV